MTDDYDYNQLTLAQRRESARSRVHELEAQRFNILLNKLANGGNPNTDARKDYDEPMRLVENGIAAVRQQLQELDDELAKSAPGATLRTPAPAASDALPPGRPQP